MSLALSQRGPYLSSSLAALMINNLLGLSCLNARKPVFGVCEQQRPSQISALVIRLLESIISKIATSKFLIFLLVSVAEGEWFDSCFVVTTPIFE